MNGRPLNDILWHLRRLVAPRHSTGLTDTDLVERFVTQHDQAAFEALLVRHGPMVWGVCRGLLVDLHTAEDAFQATWLVFIRKAGSIRRPCQLANWLYGVAHKVAARARVSAGRQRTGHLEEIEMLGSTRADEPAARELSRVLHEELNRLPAKYRTPMILCYLEGRTQAEAAEALGWTQGAVRGRLERGRNRLRVRLERRGIALSAGVLAVFLSESASAAVLPALLARFTIVAALQFAAKDGMAVAAATTSAVALAEGVCRMMTMAKLKVIVLLLLVAGLFGGGAGLLANRGVDEAQAAQQPGEVQPAPGAQKPPGVKPRPEQAANRDPAHASPADLRMALHEVESLEAVLRNKERYWEDELLDARKHVLRYEEQLRLLEAKHQAEREQEKSDFNRAREVVKATRMMLEELQSEVQRYDPGSAVGKQLSERIQKTKVRVDQAQAAADELDPRFQKQERSRSVPLMEVRFAILGAQEKVRQIERRQARERARMEADLEIADQQVRQARWEPQAAAAAEKRAGAEKKLDRLLREVEELRRELRHEPGSEGRPATQKRQ